MSGRSGSVIHDERTPVLGTVLVHDGPPSMVLLTISGSCGVRVDGLFFSTAARPEDLAPPERARFLVKQRPLPGPVLSRDTLVHISQPPGGSATEDIWLEDVGAGWIGGSGEIDGRVHPDA